MNAVGAVPRHLQARRGPIPLRRHERWLRPIRGPQTLAELAAAGTASGMLLVALVTLLARGWPGLSSPWPMGRRAPNLAAPSTSWGGGRLYFPVPAVSLGAMSDSFRDPRGKRTHLAVDIQAPRGSPVVAVADGTVARLSRSKTGGISLYQLDAGGRYCFFYAHLDRYSEGLAAGQPLRCGQLVGYVGSTGNASPKAPHLHFAISELTVPKQWWGGHPIDPYPLWR